MIQIPVEPAVTEYLYKKASIAKIPLSGTFELTPVCNMSCKMCYVRMTKAQQQMIAPLRSAKEWLSLAAQAREAGMLYILITGGEPFLHPEIREILTGLSQMGFILSINTNGTLIDEACVQWLKEAPPARFNITLYGASDETYLSLCGNPQGFTQTTRAIALLRDAGMTVKINCSLTPHNASDFDKIVAYAKEENLIIQANSYMFPPLRRDPQKVGQNDRFTPEEAAYYAARIEAALGGEAAFLSKPETELPPLPSDNEENCLDTGDIMRCRAGRCSFWVTWEGKMMACGMLPCNNEKNVFENGFTACWQDTLCSTQAIRLPAKCAECPVKDTCRTCAAMVITETGDYHQAPEYRCRMTQAYPSQRRRVKDELLHSKVAQDSTERSNDL